MSFSYGPDSAPNNLCLEFIPGVDPTVVINLSLWSDFLGQGSSLSSGQVPGKARVISSGQDPGISRQAPGQAPGRHLVKSSEQSYD